MFRILRAWRLLPKLLPRLAVLKQMMQFLLPDGRGIYIVGGVRGVVQNAEGLKNAAHPSVIRCDVVPSHNTTVTDLTRSCPPNPLVLIES